MIRIILLCVTSFAMTGCCSLFCEPTICDEGTVAVPDGGTEIVERDGKPALYGGSCVAEDDA